MGTQDYFQNKFPFGYIKEFVELALIYMNELGLENIGHIVRDKREITSLSLT